MLDSESSCTISSQRRVLKREPESEKKQEHTLHACLYVPTHTGMHIPLHIQYIMHTEINMVIYKSTSTVFVHCVNPAYEVYLFLCTGLIRLVFPLHINQLNCLLIVLSPACLLFDLCALNNKRVLFIAGTVKFMEKIQS